MLHLLATGARADPPSQEEEEEEEEEKEEDEGESVQSSDAMPEETKNEKEEYIRGALKEIEQDVQQLWEGLVSSNMCHVQILFNFLTPNVSENNNFDFCLFYYNMEND